jgi:hypothetical protein
MDRYWGWAFSFRRYQPVRKTTPENFLAELNGFKGKVPKHH